MITDGVRAFMARDWGRVRDAKGARRSDLDAARIRRLLKLLEEALDQSDLVSEFETISQLR